MKQRITVGNLSAVQLVPPGNHAFVAFQVVSGLLWVDFVGGAEVTETNGIRFEPGAPFIGANTVPVILFKNGIRAISNSETAEVVVQYY